MGMKDNQAYLGTCARNSSYTEGQISDLGLDCRGFESGFHCLLENVILFLSMGVVLPLKFFGRVSEGQVLTLTYLCEYVYLQKKVGNVVFPPGSVVPPKKPGSFEKGGMGIEVSAR